MPKNHVIVNLMTCRHFVYKYQPTTLEYSTMLNNSVAYVEKFWNEIVTIFLMSTVIEPAQETGIYQI